jgi:hypothetical protein
MRSPCRRQPCARCGSSCDGRRPRPARAAHKDALPSFGLIALTAAATIAPILWLGIAAVVTGRSDAYTATQRLWGFSFDAMTAVERWTTSIGEFGHNVYFTSVILTLVLVAVLTVLALRRPMPLELRAYTVCSALFLFAISQPQSIAFGSIPRFAFGIVTLPIVAALQVRRTIWCVTIVAVSIVLQYWWVLNIWSGRLGTAP